MDVQMGYALVRRNGNPMHGLLFDTSKAGLWAQLWQFPWVIRAMRVRWDIVPAMRKGWQIKIIG